MRPPSGQTPSSRPRCTQLEDKKTTCGSKFEVEACKKIEELESSKQKINTHAFETEVQLDEISMEYERTAATISEKRDSNFEKVLHEWKVKAEDLALELEAVRSEATTEDSIDQLNIAGMVSADRAAVCTG